jgi:hypothetical protein
LTTTDDGHPAVEALGKELAKLEAARVQLNEAVSAINAAIRDVDRARREAIEEVRRIAKPQVQKLLAKEFERTAQELRQRT